MRKLVVPILISGFILFSCSKENSEEFPQEGTLKIEGVSYDIEHGELLRFDILEEGVAYYCPIYLLSSEFDLTPTEVNGIGQLIELTLIFETKDYIEPGFYTVFDEDNPKISTFQFGLFNNFHADTWKVDAYYAVTSGSIEVVKSGAVYELKINVITDKYDIEFAGMEPDTPRVDSNLTITCHYKGELRQKYFE